MGSRSAKRPPFVRGSTKALPLLALHIVHTIQLIRSLRLPSRYGCRSMKRLSSLRTRTSPSAVLRISWIVALLTMSASPPTAAMTSGLSISRLYPGTASVSLAASSHCCQSFPAALSALLCTFTFKWHHRFLPNFG